MSQTPTSNAVLPPEQEEKLRELTTQSWNLELVISGAALFAVLQFPDLLDQLFDYLRYNLISQTTGLHGLLPSLAYSMMKATCYVLFMAFLTNFVMRAFWVGLVGLLAVYPTGVHYDRIPFISTYTRDRMAAELGPLDAYILRLDRRCNSVFAVAFLFVVLLIIMAFAYVLLLLIYPILRPLIPAPYWQGIKLAANLLFAGYLLTSIVLILPKVKAHPKGAILQYQLSSLNKLVYWGFHKPFSFILNTFYSHLPYQKILRTAALMLGVFFLLIAGEFLADFSRIDRRLVSFNRRQLYTARVDSFYINPSAYDDQRAEDDYVDEASIQSDVIREPFLRVYIAYPKALDTLLTRLAPKPEWNDKLPREERYRLAAEWSSQRINQLMRLDINDSLYQQPDLLFTQRAPHQQRGWQTILLPTNLKKGKNMLKISIQADSSAQRETIVTIPFWYVPEP